MINKQAQGASESGNWQEDASLLKWESQRLKPIEENELEVSFAHRAHPRGDGRERFGDGFVLLDKFTQSYLWWSFSAPYNLLLSEHSSIHSSAVSWMDVWVVFRLSHMVVFRFVCLCLCVGGLFTSIHSMELDPYLNKWNWPSTSGNKLLTPEVENSLVGVEMDLTLFLFCLYLNYFQSSIDWIYSFSSLL